MSRWAPWLLAPLMLWGLSCSSSDSDSLRISSVSPQSASARSGHRLTLTGQGFSSGAQVQFNDTPAASVKVLSSGELEVMTPTLLAGPVTISVHNPDGKSASIAGAYSSLPLDLSFAEAGPYYLPSLDGLTVTDAIAQDFDKDGDMDLFLSVQHGANQLWLNSGSGSFKPRPDAGVESDDAGSESEDASVDASSEAGTSSEGGTGRDGGPGSGADAGADAGAGANLPIPLWNNDVRKIAVADFDGDGQSDIFFCNGSRELHRLLLGNGKGQFTAAPDSVLSHAVDSCLSVAASDINRDGRVDLAVLAQDPSDSGKSYVRIYLNQAQSGSFAFAPSPELEQAPTGDKTPCGSVSSSPSDNLASCTISAKQISSGTSAGKLAYDFSKGAGKASVAFSSPPLSTAPEAVELDVYGDGSGMKLQIRLVDSSQEQFTYAAGNISWTGWKHIRADKIGSWTHADGNADGVLDMPLSGVAIDIDSGTSTKKGELYLDNLELSVPQTGWVSIDDFERPTFSLSYAEALNGLVAGDLDGDGDTDLALSGAQSGTQSGVRLIINDTEPASGTSASSLRLRAAGPGQVPPITDAVYGLVLLDTNGDHALDIVSIGSGQDRLLVNDGAGHFFDDTLACMPLDRAEGHFGAVSDWDLDGRLDLAIANWGAVNRLYLNRGTQRLVDVTPALPLNKDHSRILVPLDVDGDSVQDLLVINQNGEPARLYVSVEQAPQTQTP